MYCNETGEQGRIKSECKRNYFLSTSKSVQFYVLQAFEKEIIVRAYMNKLANNVFFSLFLRGSIFIWLAESREESETK